MKRTMHHTPAGRDTGRERERSLLCGRRKKSELMEKEVIREKRKRDGEGERERGEWRVAV